MGIFKAYDIRGRFGSELTTDMAHRIGRCLPRVVPARRALLGRRCTGVRGGGAGRGRGAVAGRLLAAPHEGDGHQRRGADDGLPRELHCLSRLQPLTHPRFGQRLDEIKHIGRP